MTAPANRAAIIDVPPPREAAAVLNAMTVDVEDYFQVQAFADRIPRATWEHIPGRVEGNVEKLLALFNENGVRATFFTLGWVAERHPALVHRIAESGHELASHGYDHTPADHLTPPDFREDIKRSKSIIEDITGSPVLGYRAPTFSIGKANEWVYDILEEAGYAYSSSIYPIRHDLYGDPDGPRRPFRPARRNLWEFPLTTRRLLGQNLPTAGGGYFRLTPYWLWRRNLHHLNAVESVPCIFYLHPWEIDAAQPRVQGINIRTQLRHYTNLRKTANRLSRLVQDFKWGRMDETFAQQISQADATKPAAL